MAEPRSDPAQVLAPGGLEGLSGTVYAAAAFSVGAALVHLWVMPPHFAAWWGYGAFFLVVALAQGLLGVLLLRWPCLPVLLAGIFGNLTVVLMYVLSRTRGLPLGPHAGSVEDVGFLDMAATTAEVCTVVALVSTLRGRTREWLISALLAVGVALWAMRLLGLLS